MHMCQQTQEDAQVLFQQLLISATQQLIAALHPGPYLNSRADGVAGLASGVVQRAQQAAIRRHLREA